MEKAELKTLMESKGITSANQLALLVGVNRSTALRWIKGERRIDRAAAALIRSTLSAIKKPGKK